MFKIVVNVKTLHMKKLLLLSVLAIGMNFAGRGQVVISQVYGGGGNTGSFYKNDFIEIFNRGAASVSLNGYSVQYASATGSSWQVTNLTNVSLSPGQYYLIQEAVGAGGTAWPISTGLPRKE